jgi:hypothetical protein
MRSFLLAAVACSTLACAAPARAVIVVAPVVTPETVAPSPLLQKVWWDRFHHWHRGFFWGGRWHRFPRPR